MTEQFKHRVAAFFLLIYMPAAIGVSFIHSHGISVSSDHHNSVQKQEAASVVQPDLFCTICKFLSSHHSVADDSGDPAIGLNRIIISERPEFESSAGILLLSDRAPPSLA